MYFFGTGRLWAVKKDALKTPIEFAQLQNVSMDFSFDKKELYGSKQLPIKVVRSKGKIDCKASNGEFKAAALQTILSATTAVGQKIVCSDPAAAIPTTPYEITVENDSDFDTDLGVNLLAADGTVSPMIKVATSGTPTTGQYKVDVSTGKYTFAAADTGKKVIISYIYEDTTKGTTLTLGNEDMGTATTFSAYLGGQLDGVAISVWLNSCISNKLSLALKQEDFLIPDFDFSAFSDATGSPGWISLGE